MHSFLQKFADKVTGTLECFDRVIFKGHIQPLSFAQGMENLLARHGLLTKDFARFVQTHSDHLVQHAKAVAAKQGRRYEYVSHRIRKDEKASRIAERDKITEGPICVFSEVGKLSQFQNCLCQAPTLHRGRSP
jgi:hypothetical protein